MVKRILAGVLGVVSAGITIWIVEYVGHIVYPPPQGLDFANAEAMGAYVETLPTGALLFPVIAWIVGTFDGVLVAALVARAVPFVYAGVVGGLVLLATIANIAMIPHPVWVPIVAVPGIALAALGGALMGRRFVSPGEPAPPG